MGRRQRRRHAWERRRDGRSRKRASLDDVRLVEAALHRLNIGRYGDCADCGEPIGLQRLLVLPPAEHCAACQAAVERHIRDAIGRGA